uniref:ATP-binding protein n=1 Tax=Prochlorothrix hollandica TaxID=1223 RepID=UPI003342DB33
LMRQGNEERAAQLFEQSLNLDDRNVITLNSYAQLLMRQGNEERAAQLFEQALNLNDRDVITLTSYAQLLMRQGNEERAAQIFQQALELNGEDIIILRSYARLLAKSGCDQQATEMFEKALKLSPSDMITLGWYAQFLTKQGNYQQACNLLDQVVANELVHFSSRDTHAYSSFKHAQTLEAEGRYPEALDRLLKIDLSQQQPYHANIIRLNLGRLYYLLGQAQTGQDYFNTAIYLADDPDQTRLYAARSLLVHRLDLDTAIDLLQSIDEDSPRYTNARNAIALNASAQTTYGLFSEPNQRGIDSELLYRAMYHKIGNEVAILKSIAQRLLRKIQGEHPLVAEIVANLDTMQASIIQERSSQQAAIEQLSSPNYTKTLQIIAETAHNVSDWVNNELAVIESKTRRALRKLDSKSPHADHFNRLLYQLELTQAALSDLKSISEGMPIQHRRFPVCRLFEKWQPEHWSSTPRIQKARVRLFIDNPDSEFDGDEEKIKSILNELVENSLKHNANHRDLLIRIYSRDLLNPTDIAAPTIPGDRRYLYLQFIDNGQGIPQDKKDWIFQPLHTTSSDEKGSGLGLFIIRKTIQQMGGFIQEVGEPDQGVRFQIYLPYPSDSDIP